MNHTKKITPLTSCDCTGSDEQKVMRNEGRNTSKGINEP